MKMRRRVTESDLRETERRIAETYANLKRRAMRAPEEALASAGSAIKRRPLLALALFAGACAAGYGLMRVLLATPKREEGNARGSGWSALVAGLIPVALPYLVEVMKGIGRR